MSTGGAWVLFHILAAWVFLFRCSVFSLVPVPNNSPINGTVELEIHHRKDCPDGYYKVEDTHSPCKHCLICKIREVETRKCTATTDTVCGCDVGLVYSEESRGCILPGGGVGGVTSPSPPPPSNEMVTTMKASKAQSSHVQEESSDIKAQHATKPDWTDFYILTVSSTAVLFFTLSLVLLFLMAVMKARSWYLYRRLPGSGITLCFRGWMSRFLRRIFPRQEEDRATDPIEIVAGGVVCELSTDKLDRTITDRTTADRSTTTNNHHQLGNSEVVDYLEGMGAVVCCADLHFTFPQKKTYVTSCVTSASEVAETRSKWCPAFTAQAVNVVLGHHDHRCCRHRNVLTLTSSEACEPGCFDAATMEFQEQQVPMEGDSGRGSSDYDGDNNRNSAKGNFLTSEEKNNSLKSEEKDAFLTSEYNVLLPSSEESPCRHQETAGISACEVLTLYREIAAPFKDSRDLVFSGSLKLYLRSSSPSHHGRVKKEKVKLKYNRRGERRREHSGEAAKDSEESEALLKSGISDVRYLYSPSSTESGEGCIPGGVGDECIPADEAVSESSVEVVVDVHGEDGMSIAVTSV